MKELLDFVLLGVFLAIVTIVAFLLQDRYTHNLTDLGDAAMAYTKKQIILGICIILPIGMWIILNFPIEHVVFFELIVGTMLVGFTVYVLTKKKLALLLGFVYPILYYNFWNNCTLNLVAMFMALGAILLIQTRIKPNHMLLICGLIVVYDFIMVYLTRDMIEAAHKIVEVELPLYVAVQLTEAPGLLLGLGDVFIFALLALKVIEYYNYDKRGELCFVVLFSTLTVVSLVIAIQITPGGVPATIPIFFAALISMWLFETTCNIMNGKKDKPKNTVSLGSD